MPDFRISDTAAEHPKLRAAGLAAAGLWGMAGSWSMAPTQLTDGWIPAYWVATWPGGTRAARRLVQVGLWTEEERNGVRGYQYHDWVDYQRTRAKVEEEQRKARERMSAARNRPRSRDVRPNTNGTFARTPDERSPHVHDSLTLTHTHGASGEGKSPLARAESNDPPAPTCPKHANDPAPGPCGACADARRAREQWEHLRARAQAEVAADIEAARADPRQRCEHGTDGGKFNHPDTGQSATCALCRKAENARGTA